MEDLTQGVVSGTGQLQLSSFLPEPSSDMEYFAYYGSLTTPDYNEIVFWTVIKEVLPIEADQVWPLRT